MMNEIEQLKQKLAQYENTFRGVEVRVGGFWRAGSTKKVYEHDEDGIILNISIDEDGRKMLDLYEDGEGFSMYEDGKLR
jgi:hypothetical protein